MLFLFAHTMVGKIEHSFPSDSGGRSSMGDHEKSSCCSFLWHSAVCADPAQGCVFWKNWLIFAWSLLRRAKVWGRLSAFKRWQNRYMKLVQIKELWYICKCIRNGEKNLSPYYLLGRSFVFYGGFCAHINILFLKCRPLGHRKVSCFWRAKVRCRSKDVSFLKALLCGINVW